MCANCAASRALRLVCARNRERRRAPCSSGSWSVRTAQTRRRRPCARRPNWRKTTGAKLEIVSAFEPVSQERLREESGEVPGRHRLRGRARGGRQREPRGAPRRRPRRPGSRSTPTPARAIPPTPSSTSPRRPTPSLIVVGNKGMTGARRFLLGSVPNKISHHAPVRRLHRPDDVDGTISQVTSRPAGAAPARPRAAAPRPRPDRPGVRAAAGRRGARPRRAHVGRAPQPPVPARLRRVAVQLPDDAAHRARDGAAASRRPQRHRGLLRGRLLVAGHLQHSLHRAGRHAAQRLPARRRRARRRGCRRAWRSR